MKTLRRCIGLAFVAALASFGTAVFAAPAMIGYYVPRYMLALNESQGVAVKRLQLTLAQWRNQTDAASNDAVSSNLRVSSNGFMFKGLLGQHTPAKSALT